MGFTNSRSRFRFGIFEVDFESGELWKHGRKLALHDQPLQALALLLERPGEVVTREQFRQGLWPADTFVDFDKSLNTTISKLREVLGDSAAHPRFIETMPRRGYRFLYPVEAFAKPTESAAGRPAVARTWVWTLAIIFPVLAGIYWLRQTHQVEAIKLRVTPLTSYPGDEQQPSLSPDGNQVAFAWNAGGSSKKDEANSNDYDIYTKPLGSEDLFALTSDPADDLSPSWSPDGQTIAFLRFLSDQRASVVLIPSGGGPERELATIVVHGRHSNIRVSWSPDGQWIATSDAETPQSSMRLALISAKSGEKRTLGYNPSGLEADVSPSFSPNGKYLAFARQISPVVSDIYVLELPREGRPVSQPVRVTNWNRMSGTPLWTQDGQDLLFIGDEPRLGPRIWKVPAFGRAEARLLNQFGENSTSIAVARDGARLVYSKENKDTNIWRISLPAGEPAPRGIASLSPLIASTRLDTNPQYSRDGKRIVYQSERSGAAELWVCNSDGSSSHQLTRLNAKVSGYPRWSPDGKHIVFHSRPSGYANIFVVDVETGAYQQLTSGATNDIAPTWSHNGRWIYFCSGRNDGHQIWRIPAEGGPASRVTTNGGLVALESVDEKQLFYSKLNQPGLWVLPLDGGTESQLLPDLSGQDTFAVTAKGIYFVRPTKEKKAALSFRSFDSEMIHDLALISAPLDMGLTVSPDGQSILYTQADQAGSDLILVDNLK